MDLQFISDNFRKFPQVQLDGWGDPLDTLLKALFDGYIAPGFDDTFVEFFDRSRGAVYTLLDLPHDSDEDCVIRLVTIDDKPLGLAFKFGDRSSWGSRIIDVETFRALAAEISAAAMEKKLARVTADKMDTLRSLESGYLHFLGEKESMFAVQSPKWMCGFSHLLKTHRGYFIDENGQALVLEAIGKFTNNKQHSSDGDAHDVIVTIGGVERVVPGQQLMFEMAPDLGDIADALKAYATTPAWLVEGIDVRRKVATVLIRTPHHWSTTVAWPVFDSDEELQRFAEAHFDHDKPGEEQLVQGVFDLKALGYLATESTRC